MPQSVWKRALVCVVFAAAACRTATGRAADAPQPRLDPLAKAVVESLAFPPRTTPAELLEAAIRAADVEAFDVAGGYVSRLADLLEKAGDGRTGLLADLGDLADPAGLRRLERLLGDSTDDVRPLVRAIREAARARRRDPARLARDSGDLASESIATRTAAVDRLRRAGVDALPVLVDLLQGDAAVNDRTRLLARQLVRDLGAEARQPLLAWLGSDDVEHWPGVIEALAAGVTADDPPDFEEFLLAPAIVADVPQATRTRATALLRRLADRRGMHGDTVAVPPAAGAAIAVIARRLDRVLSIDGLPAADHLLTDTVVDPATAALAAGKTVERFVWNPEAGRLVRLDLPPTVARAQEAMHLARDLAALGATEPAAVRLVLLARLEAMLAAAGDPATAADRIPAAALQEAVAGPDGFDFEAAGDVLDLAASRGMFPAAAAAARAIAVAYANPTPAAAPAGPTAEPPAVPAPSPAVAATLPVSVRNALLRSLVVPDAGLQFEAARTLALTAGDPPYRGSSRVVELLLHAATSLGEEIAVVAHHDAEVRESLATGLSRFGYRCEKVATGREAILATRANIDTVLVVIGARTIRPTPLETVQFIQKQAVGDVPAVLVVVDPLDDDARGKFLTQLLLKFSDLNCVGIIDRLDSLFLPRVDPATGTVVGPPRFPDHLAQAAGPQAVVPAARQARATGRRTRAAQALSLLADLGRRGWDISAAETTARLAFMQGPQPAAATDLFGPAAAVLATLGSGQAQQALLRATERVDLPEAARKIALSRFSESVDRYGVALECRPLQAAHARYNLATASSDRALAGAVLDVLEMPSRKARSVSADAAHPRPPR